MSSVCHVTYVNFTKMSATVKVVAIYQHKVKLARESLQVMVACTCYEGRRMVSANLITISGKFYTIKLLEYCA